MSDDNSDTAAFILDWEVASARYPQTDPDEDISVALKKYIYGQRVIRAWCQAAFEESGDSMALWYSMTPSFLYENLERIGYTWNRDARRWKLGKARKYPRMPVWTPRGPELPD